MNKPFFSIIIPTYNRTKDLNRAVQCILLNDFRNYEIIVVDNSPSDEVKHLVKQIKSSKIIYIKNTVNIGWIRSLKKGMRIAKGKYVIFHGDDDFLIYQDILKQAYSLLKKHNYGFIRLNFLRLSHNKKRLFDNYKKIFNDMAIRPYQKSEKIIEFLTIAEIHFITGIIYKNYEDAYRDIIYSESGPWFNILFKNVYNHGAYLLSKPSFIAQWSRTSSYNYYFLQNGKLTIEAYYNEISKVVSKEYFSAFLKKELKIQFTLMPAAKLYTNLQNFFKYAGRILFLSPEFKYSFVFWMYFFIALFTPKFILRLVRSYNDSGYRSYRIPNYNKVLKRVQFLNQYINYADSI